MKCMPVFPTDKEEHENECAHVANCSQCKTEDSRKHLENESSVPRVAMDRGFLAHRTDADLVTNTMLIQKLHSVAEARQVTHEAPESHAVNCVQENLDANCLGRVLLRGDVGSAVPDTRRPALGRTKQRRVRSVCIQSGERTTLTGHAFSRSPNIADRLLRNQAKRRWNKDGCGAGTDGIECEEGVIVKEKCCPREMSWPARVLKSAMYCGATCTRRRHHGTAGLGKKSVSPALPCRVSRVSASVGVRRRPSASVGVRRRPSASVGVRRRPSASVGVRRRPSASVAVRRGPSRSVAVRRGPSRSVAVRRGPSPSVAVRRRPSPSVAVRRRPSPSVAVRRRPSPSVAVRRRPSRPSPSVASVASVASLPRG